MDATLVSIDSFGCSYFLAQDLIPDFLIPSQYRVYSAITEDRTEFSEDRSLGH